MARNESDPVAAAMAATEQEVFAAGFGEDPEDETATETETGESETEGSQDETGEGEDGESEGESEQTGEQEAGEQQEAKPGEVEKPREAEGRVPSGKLREANERARSAEAERDREKTEREQERGTHRREIDALSAKLDGALAILNRLGPGEKGQPAQAQLPKPDELPDIFENPQGFVGGITKQVDSRLADVGKQFADFRVEMSMQMAHGRHGDVFGKAFEAINKLDPRNPSDRATVANIYSAANPGEALVSWHKRSETLREVGDDPAAYRTRVADEARQALMKDPEFRKQLLADLRAEANTGEEGRPRTVVRLPKSLNGASGNNSSRGVETTYEDSESGIFNAAFRA